MRILYPADQFRSGAEYTAQSRRALSVPQTEASNPFAGVSDVV